jgi:hypothetical protein
MDYKLSIGEILGEEHRRVEVTRDYVGEINGAEPRVNHILLLFGLLCVASELQGDQDVLSDGSIKTYKSQGHLQSLELISCITIVELLALFEAWGKALQESRMDTKQNIPSRIANSSGLDAPLNSTDYCCHVERSGDLQTLASRRPPVHR